MKNENAKHTPGPLALKQRPGTVGLAIQHDGKTIGTAHDIGDAKLWAAAPDLLAALEMLISNHDNCGQPRMLEVIPAARAAIAKARGEK